MRRFGTAFILLIIMFITFIVAHSVSPFHAEKEGSRRTRYIIDSISKGLFCDIEVSSNEGDSHDILNVPFILCIGLHEGDNVNYYYDTYTEDRSEISQDTSLLEFEEYLENGRHAGIEKSSFGYFSRASLMIQLKNPIHVIKYIIWIVCLILMFVITDPKKIESDVKKEKFEVRKLNAYSNNNISNTLNKSNNIEENNSYINKESHKKTITATWIKNDMFSGMTCSNCNYHQGKNTDKFCKSCGAKMN